MLYSLPIRKEYVKEAGIGELLVKLWRNPKETKENRKILHMIIEKWLRIVTGMASTFNETDNDEMEDLALEKQEYLKHVRRVREPGCANRRAESFVVTQEEEDRSIFAMLPKFAFRASNDL